MFLQSAKYPLAIVSRLLSTIGRRLGVGYDIGCDFQKTVANSSLGHEAKEKLLRFVVGAFHGYSHCYPCQLQYHPSVVRGMGLEDLETMERMWGVLVNFYFLLIFTLFSCSPGLLQ